MDSLVFNILQAALGKATSSGKEYRFMCPWCMDSGMNNLSIVQETNENGQNPWHCFSCKNKGRYVRDILKKSAPDKVKEVDTIIVPRYHIRSEREKPIDLKLPDEFKSLKALGERDYVGKQAIAYLTSRGFTGYDIVKYNMGFCETGKYRNRIIFPSYDANRKLNYFVARTFIQDVEPRYLSCDAPRRDIVPFELFINWNVPVILCEGFFDARAIARNAIPLMEKNISPGIMNKLLNNDVKKIYLALDKDAISNSLDHADTLISHGKKVYLIELVDKDPAEMGFKAFTELVHTAKALTREEIILRKFKMKLYE